MAKLLTLYSSIKSRGISLVQAQQQLNQNTLLDLPTSSAPAPTASGSKPAVTKTSGAVDFLAALTDGSSVPAPIIDFTGEGEDGSMNMLHRLSAIAPPPARRPSATPFKAQGSAAATGSLMQSLSGIHITSPSSALASVSVADPFASSPSGIDILLAPPAPPAVASSDPFTTSSSIDAFLPSNSQPPAPAAASDPFASSSSIDAFLPSNGNATQSGDSSQNPFDIF